MRKFIVAIVAALALAPAALAAGPTVYVDNQSMTVSQAELTTALPAFQLAVSRDLAAAWGTDATLTTDPNVPADMVVQIEDDATCFGCLGYHDVIGHTPTSRVFARTSQQINEAWPLIFTHELFEMLVDPWINHFARWHQRTWLVEVGDPVESGYYAYFIDGVPISDFVTPRWYDKSLPGPFDAAQRLSRAGQIGRHGYASYLDPGSLSGWGQVFG